MEKTIYLIGDTVNQDLMQEAAEYLKKSEYNPIVCTTDLLFNRWSFVVNADIVILFITPKANNDVYKLASTRYSNKKYTLNYIIEPTIFNNKQKLSIGKNDTVFKTLEKNSNQEIIDLLSKVDEFIFIETGEQHNADSYMAEDNDSSSKSKTWMWLFAVACLIGFGIWGYSAYVESAKEAAEENLWNSWSDYLDKTDAGGMVKTMGELFLKKDISEFKNYGFENYIDGRIEATGDLSWGDIGPYINGISIKYNPPLDFNSYLAGPLKELYDIASANGFDNSDNWNPIAILNNSTEITIDEITVEPDGSRGRIFYSIPNYSDNIKLGIMMNSYPGEWLISDFYYGDLSFAYLLENFKQNLLASKTINYVGNVYTPSGTFPISLTIEFDGTPSVTAIYNNINSNITLNMSGYDEDGYVTLFYEDSNQKVSFDLARDSESVLTGKFNVTPMNEDTKSYDVVLKEEIPE